MLTILGFANNYVITAFVVVVILIVSYIVNNLKMTTSCSGHAIVTAQYCRRAVYFGDLPDVIVGHIVSLSDPNPFALTYMFTICLAARQLTRPPRSTAFKDVPSVAATATRLSTQVAAAGDDL